MKILVFGKCGQVGWELCRSLQPLGQVVAMGREDADFSKPESLREIVRAVQPDVIVNAAAYTAVDKAEQEEDLALLINAESPKVLAEEALKINALLVHYSTDYVFDGTSVTPYTETDVAGPVNVYGRTKLAGELSTQLSGCDYLIFRTSWVYASRGNNFLLTMLRLVKERDEISVIADQHGAPTSARLIAEVTLVCASVALKERRAGVFSSGIYHLTASGSTSWHGFAKEIISIASHKYSDQIKLTSLKAITTSEYGALAARPENSRLDLNKLKRVYDINMPDWKESLELCIEEI